MLNWSDGDDWAFGDWDFLFIWLLEGSGLLSKLQTCYNWQKGTKDLASNQTETNVPGYYVCISGLNAQNRID